MKFVVAIFCLVSTAMNAQMNHHEHSMNEERNGMHPMDDGMHEKHSMDEDTEGMQKMDNDIHKMHPIDDDMNELNSTDHGHDDVHEMHSMDDDTHEMHSMDDDTHEMHTMDDDTHEMHSMDDDTHEMHSMTFPLWSIYPSSVIAGFGLILNLMSLFYFVKRRSDNQDLGKCKNLEYKIRNAFNLYKIECLRRISTNSVLSSKSIERLQRLKE